MLAHFQDYNDVVGDHPQNLRATTLAFNAYALTHEAKYKDWVLEYVGAWVERAKANNNIMPSNIGLDGKIGSAAGGKWYGGVYGWGFTVKVPQTGEMADRPRTESGWAGLRSALVMTGDDKYADCWRKQIDAINANRREVNGRVEYPRMFGDNGWYGWTRQPYAECALELYMLSLRAGDAARVGSDQWLEFLRGNRPVYPEVALRRDLASVRRRVLGQRADTTTPDTRLADDPMKYNPCSVDSLLQLAMGSVPQGRGGNTLVSALRYFDGEARRPGLPPDVAALVTRIAADGVDVTLVNVNQLQPRTLLIQGGAYGEHQLSGAGPGSQHITVQLAPGAGQSLTLPWKRFANQPTLELPWN
jgi:hypothetical protein